MKITKNKLEVNVIGIEDFFPEVMFELKNKIQSTTLMYFKNLVVFLFINILFKQFIDILSKVKLL